MGIGSILILLVVLIVSVVFPVVAPNFGATTEFLKQYSNYSNIIFSFLAFIMCLFTASKYDKKDETRLAWMFIGFGSMMYAVAQLIYMIHGYLYPELTVPPYPWWHDIFFLLTPTMMAIGVWNLRKSFKVSASGLGAFLATLVGLAAITIAFVVQWLLLTGEGTTILAITATILYSILDPIMLGLAVLAMTMMVGGLVSRPWWMIIFAIFIIYAADIIYNYMNMAGTYQTGMIVDVTWPFAFGLIIVASIWNREILG